MREISYTAQCNLKPFQKNVAVAVVYLGTHRASAPIRPFLAIHSQGHTLDFAITLNYSTNDISNSNPDTSRLSTESSYFPHFDNFY